MNALRYFQLAAHGGKCVFCIFAYSDLISSNIV